jgi:hypothetical protein
MNSIKTENWKCRLLLTIAIFLLVLSACRQQEFDPEAEAKTPTTTIESTPIATTLSSTPQKENTESYPTKNETSLSATPPVEIEEVLEQSLLSNVDWFIIVENDSGEVLFSKNPDQSFAPASMIKIPTAMVVLKILEDQGKTLEDIQTYGISGRNFSDLLSAMVVNSEEKASEALEYFARGNNRLAEILKNWGLTHTTYDPRRSSATDLLLSLKLLKTDQALNQEFTRFLLNQMAVYTSNDEILLCRLSEKLPQCEFYNKRGTLLNPTIVADMGILECGDSYWYLVIAGTPAPDSSATFEDIQGSLEAFAESFGDYVQVQLENSSVD